MASAAFLTMILLLAFELPVTGLKTKYDESVNNSLHTGKSPARETGRAFRI